MILNELENQVECFCDDKDIYVIGAKNGDKCGLAITYYTENDNEGAKKIIVKLDGVDVSKLKLYLTDEKNTYTPYDTYEIENNEISMRLERNSILYIEG